MLSADVLVDRGIGKRERHCRKELDNAKLEDHDGLSLDVVCVSLRDDDEERQYFALDELPVQEEAQSKEIGRLSVASQMAQEFVNEVLGLAKGGQAWSRKEGRGRRKGERSNQGRPSRRVPSPGAQTCRALW